MRCHGRWVVVAESIVAQLSKTETFAELLCSQLKGTNYNAICNGMSTAKQECKLHEFTKWACLFVNLGKIWNLKLYCTKAYFVIMQNNHMQSTTWHYNKKKILLDLSIIASPKNLDQFHMQSICTCVCVFRFNVTFNNFSVISRRCLVATGSSMLTFIVLPHWSIMSQTLDMIPHPVTLSWNWVDQS